ncbi:iron-sulfur cluster assembly accessory protein [Salsipaludibacter albus]|uniref:HesB/IscA family protein n=1 Tax=Salsipaludibacter albus TaxID=2849650 RepID=UPI0030846B02
MSADVTVDETIQGAPAEADVLTLTPKAAEKVQGFLADADEEQVALRVAVQAGGCAGFRYALFFDDRQLDGDLVSAQHGVEIRLDQMSAPYMQGAVIDWKESLEASGFSIENPNASGGCACGDSASF